MQHREIFTTKYLREAGKHFDLLRDVPDLADDLYGLTADERALVLAEGNSK